MCVNSDVLIALCSWSKSRDFHGVTEMQAPWHEMKGQKHLAWSVRSLLC